MELQVIDSGRESSVEAIDIGQIEKVSNSGSSWITEKLSQVAIAIGGYFDPWISTTAGATMLGSQEYIVAGTFLQTALVFPGGTYWVSTDRDDWTPVLWERPIGDAFTQQFSSALTKLRSTLELKQDWDSYGAVPPSRTAVARSYVLLWELYEYFTDLDETLPMPFVAPVPDGRIQYEWQSDEREIEITIDEKGIIEYLLFRTDDILNYDVGRVSKVRELGEILRFKLFRKADNS